MSKTYYDRSLLLLMLSLLLLLLIHTNYCDDSDVKESIEVNKRDSRASASACGGRLVSKNGFLSTPGFPGRFRTPLNCEWIVCADDVDSAEKITVYMTQLYAFTGLIFTEYGYYDSEYKMGGRKVHEVTEENVTKVKWIEVSAPYLVITFKMPKIEPGQHLRALDHFLDVYGFNITYQIYTKEDVRKKLQIDYVITKSLNSNTSEIEAKNSLNSNSSVSDRTTNLSDVSVSVSANRTHFERIEIYANSTANNAKVDETMEEVAGNSWKSVSRSFKNNSDVEANLKTSCSVLECRYLGHCYANADFSGYSCVCFDGYSGPDCGQGPLCQNPHNGGCANGATCRHLGASAVTCQCAPGFQGDKCDIPVFDLNNNEECFQDKLDIEEINPVNKKKCFCNNSNSNPQNADLFRYKVMLYLSNTTLMFIDVNTELKKMAIDYLSQQLPMFLGNNTILNLKIIYLKVGMHMAFQFFSNGENRDNIVECLRTITSGGWLGTLPLVNREGVVKQEPVLYINSVEVNKPLDRILEGQEFILSCTAKGPQKTSFRWYKDGVFVNVTRATRSMWTRLTSHGPNSYTYMLAISGTISAVDSGRYTCMARENQDCATDTLADCEDENCVTKSMIIRVRPARRLRIEPMAISVRKGESVLIKCLSTTGSGGYSWTRDGYLFAQNQPSPDDFFVDGNSTKHMRKDRKIEGGETDNVQFKEFEIWEDLRPDGSVLQIINAQRSHTYACHLSGGDVTSRVTAKVLVSVGDVTGQSSCQRRRRPYRIDSNEEETQSNDNKTLYWPQTLPGVQSIVPCPSGSTGIAKRSCDIDFENYENSDVKDSVIFLNRSIETEVNWGVSDYSECVPDVLQKYMLLYQRLSSGHDVTKHSQVMIDIIHHYLSLYSPSTTNPLPGSLNAALELIENLSYHYTISRMHTEPDSWSETIQMHKETVRAVSELLQYDKGIIRNKGIQRLQMLVRSQIQVLSGVLHGDNQNVSLVRRRKEVYIKLYEGKENWTIKKAFGEIKTVAVARFGGFLEFQVSAKEEGDLWTSDSISVRIKTRDKNINKFIQIYIASYKNLARLLPKFYSAKISGEQDEEESEFSIASHITSLDLLTTSEVTETRIEIVHESIKIDFDKGWRYVCGHREQNLIFDGFGWNIHNCKTLITSETDTNIAINCICHKSGVFAVLQIYIKDEKATILKQIRLIPKFLRPLTIFTVCLCAVVSIVTAMVLLLATSIGDNRRHAYQCLISTAVLCSLITHELLNYNYGKYKTPWLTSFILFLTSQLILTSQVSNLLFFTQFLQQSTMNFKSDDREKLCEMTQCQLMKNDESSWKRINHGFVLGNHRTKWGTVICIGEPFLGALSGALADAINGSRGSETGSPSFILLCIGVVLITVLYSIIYCTLMKKLKMVKEMAKDFVIAKESYSTLKKSLAIYCSSLALITSSIYLARFHSTTSTRSAMTSLFCLSIFSLIQTCIIIFCYLFKPKIILDYGKINTFLAKRKKLKYSKSDTNQSVLEFFMKRDPDMENCDANTRKNDIAEETTAEIPRFEKNDCEYIHLKGIREVNKLDIISGIEEMENYQRMSNSKSESCLANNVLFQINPKEEYTLSCFNLSNDDCLHKGTTAKSESCIPNNKFREENDDKCIKCHQRIVHRNKNRNKNKFSTLDNQQLTSNKVIEKITNDLDYLLQDKIFIRTVPNNDNITQTAL